MENDFIAKSSITIGAPNHAVWEALVTPETIKQYLFGTETKSDWKVGSPITFSGVWQEKTYEDKGIILAFEPEKKLQYTYWSSMAGLPDVPENYKIVTFELSEENGKTTVEISQDNNSTEASRDHSQSNWDMVLKSMKEIVEKK